MNRLSSDSKKIVIWLWANYGIFAAAFFILGTLGSGNRTILWVNFILDVAICAVSLVLNILLFLPRHKVSFLGKITAAFTWFAFLMPENGLPPVLFC